LSLAFQGARKGISDAILNPRRVDQFKALEVPGIGERLGRNQKCVSKEYGLIAKERHVDIWYGTACRIAPMTQGIARESLLDLG
jgi:hypothetical protein